jgi:hypothetical protein
VRSLCSNAGKKKRSFEAPEKAALQIVQSPYWARSGQELDDALSQFLTFADEGKYLFYEYASFFEILTDLIKNELWGETEAQMKVRVIHGCKVAMSRSTIPSSYLDTLEQNCRFSIDPDVNKLIRDEFRRRRVIGEGESIDDYFREIEGPWHIFHPKYGTFEPFSLIDVKQFAKRFVQLNLMGIRCYNAILDQHIRTQNVKDFLGAYSDQYADLKELLTVHAKNETDKLRKLLINTTIKEISKLESVIG